MNPILTLTTDFGWRDPYVAAMKGVIAARCAAARVYDLSHDLPVGDVFEAALFLAGAIPWFPAGAVHMVVVDPGVGTDRRPVAARWRDQFLVLPDNGLLTFLHRKHPVEAVREIEHADCRLESVSATFHGRDIFAPTAAALACGFRFEDTGRVVDSPVYLTVPETRIDGADVCGEVIHVDRFGNAITNIRREQLATAARVHVERAGDAIPIFTTYGDVQEGEVLALIGSSGLLEIAINRGNAAVKFGLWRRSAVHVKLSDG